MSHSRRWWFWRGVQVLGLGAGAALVGVALQPSHAATTVTYELAWDRGEAEVRADGTWTVVNDAGAEITVTDGSVATYSATLLECPHGHAWLDRLSAVFGAATAWAGHTSGGPDPAQVQVPDAVVQSLVAPTTAVLGEATLVEPDYCQAHAAVAGGGATDGATTLSVTGTWLAPGEDEAVPFTIETAQAWGAVVDADLPGTATTVRFVRRLDSLFDGVDVLTQSADEQAAAVLRSLTGQTTVRAA